MKHSAKLFWLLVVFTSQLYSLQSIPYDMPQIVGQTPDVASLLKFSETPVSYSTGIPNISIPICSLPANDLAASVSISYHAGGIRVTEDASSVGLGWNLNIGGKITRTVRSFPDDAGPHGYINSPYTVDYVKQVCNGNNTSSLTCAQLSGTHAQAQQYDYEPDDFNYSMMGLSGRFMFNQDRSNNPKGDIVQFPNKNVKITPIFNGANGSIGSWNIIDTQGNTYHFVVGNTFKSNLFYQKKNGQIEIPGDGDSYIKYTETWDLSYVTSYNGNTINLYYNTPVLNGDLTIDYNEEACFEGAEALVVQEGNNVPGTSPDLPRRINTLSCTKRTYTELSEISTSQGKIEIIRDMSQFREDIESEKRRIKYVRVFDSHDKQIKEIEFIHDYFISPPPQSSQFMGNWNYGNPDDSFLYKRLYLQELIFRGNVGSLDEYNYSFNYNTETMLPNKRSYSQDHWGFYNGKQNASLIQYANNLAAADRKSNPEFSDACVLESIVYPEGGITEFIYENNQEDPNLIFPPTLKETLKVEALLNTYHTITNNSNSDLYQFIKDFDISIDAQQSTQNNSQTEVSLSGFTSRCGNNDAFFNDDDAVCQTILLKIYQRNGNTIGNQVYSDHVWDAGTILLDRGEEYRAVIEITTSNGDYDFLNEHSEANLEWFVQNTNSPSDYVTINYFGGLRIKEIKNYHRSNILASHRKYDYQGGKILTKPYYFSVTLGNVKKYISQSWVPLLTSQSGYVHYENVKELSLPVEDNQTIGGSGSGSGNQTGNGQITGSFSENYIKRMYTNTMPPPYFPGAPSTSEIYVGKILEEEIPNLKTTTYNYFNNVYLASQPIQGFIIARTYAGDDVSNPYNQQPPRALNCFNTGICTIDANIYTLHSVNKLLTKQDEESIFYDDNNTASSMLKTKEYFYESSNLYLDLPTRITTSTSDNNILETTIKYAQDVNNTTLINENRITQPIESQSKVNGIVMQSVKSNFNTYVGKYLTDNVEVSKNNDVFEQRIKYHKYDANGKPIEVSKTDGTHIFYIYGYQSSYPIAEIKNFTYTESLNIQTLIDNAMNASNADVDRTQDYYGFEGILRNKLDAIRNDSALANAQITTYTYDPLVGITSVTDAKGYTVYYDYDDLQRMQYVKDKEGNILSENEYSYRN